VLERVLQGRLNKQIAYDLGIAEKTEGASRPVMEKDGPPYGCGTCHLCDTSDSSFPCLQLIQSRSPSRLRAAFIGKRMVELAARLSASLQGEQLREQGGAGDGKGQRVRIDESPRQPAQATFCEGTQARPASRTGGIKRISESRIHG